MNEEFNEILREAYQSVEDQLTLEDSGWIKLGTSSAGVIPDSERKLFVQKARLYAVKDPLAVQAVRLWTGYSFGTGISWSAEDKKTSEILTGFWNSPANKNVLSSVGQLKSSDKLLIDGEIFFAVFLGSSGTATVRRIDPLEITEIITNPDDLEDVRYYKREWSDAQGGQHTGYYASFANQKNEPCKDSLGATVTANQEALVYHLAINSIGQRGNSMLLPALDWIPLYRKFLASRVAVMLALARFAWKMKVKGGTAAVAAAKAVYQDQKPAAGSVQVENMGAEMTPIKTDSGAAQAYQDGRMLKLQVAAGTGWPEQYFGDISIGNLATAQTVELPVMKMCQRYQSTWKSAYDDIDNLVLGHAGIAEDKRYVDRDFPAITPEDAGALADSISKLLIPFPNFADSRDVQQAALMAMGIKDVNEALDALAGSKGSQEANIVKLTRALRGFKESLQNGDVSSLQGKQNAGAIRRGNHHKVPDLQRQG